MDTAQFTQPIWQVGLGTLISYLIILVVMFVALFVVPWAIFELSAVPF